MQLVHTARNLFKVPPHPLCPPVLRIVADSLFSLVAADLLQLPACEGYIGCLVVVDHHSKWLVAVPIRNKRAALVASLFEERVLAALPRKPERILTDNGSEFNSGEFKHVLQRYDIHHIFCTPYHPQSNGAVERSNQTVI